MNEGKKKTTKKRRQEMIKFDDFPVHIRERVYADIGEASMCWEKPEGCGIFDSQNAARIGLELCQFIIDLTEETKKR